MTDAGKRMLERYAKATPGPGVWQVTDRGWMRLPTGCGATKSTCAKLERDGVIELVWSTSPARRGHRYMRPATAS